MTIAGSAIHYSCNNRSGIGAYSYTSSNCVCRVNGVDSYDIGVATSVYSCGVQCADHYFKLNIVGSWVSGCASPTIVLKAASQSCPGGYFESAGCAVPAVDPDDPKGVPEQICAYS
jgi:hypothetical protein